MLGLGDETALTEQAWHALESRTQLPESLRDFLPKHGNDGAMAGCQRRYVRMPLRKIAIALDGNNRHACYAKNLSRMGMGFYSPVNFLPKKVLSLWLAHGETIMQLRVTRCRRLAAGCYEIGTVFDSELEDLKKSR
jgi:hypothetical protein